MCNLIISIPDLYLLLYFTGQFGSIIMVPLHIRISKDRFLEFLSILYLSTTGTEGTIFELNCFYIKSVVSCHCCWFLNLFCPGWLFVIITSSIKAQQYVYCFYNTSLFAFYMCTGATRLGLCSLERRARLPYMDMQCLRHATYAEVRSHTLYFPNEIQRSFRT